MAGSVGALFAGISIDLNSRRFLLQRALTVADTLPKDELDSLQGNEDDLENVSYQDLKRRLQQTLQDNHDARFIYVAAQQGDKLIYLVDSEDPGSPGYAAPGQELDGAAPGMQAIFENGKPLIAGPARDKDGWWMSALAPVDDPVTGQVVGVVGIDISAMDHFTRVAVYALVPLLLASIPFAVVLRDRALQRKEYEITGLKNQFVSIASHELRSPLAGMLWAIQTLMKDSTATLNMAQQALLADMYRSTEASLGTVNEILDLSIFERGQIGKLQKDVVDLVSVFRQVAATLRLGAQEKRITVHFADPWPSNVYVVGDAAALKRAFMNIVSNAIKYSPEDSTIDLTYRIEGSTHIVGIRDHGIGIPKDEQAKVLEGYYRAKNATKIQAHGTGLGLWLCRLVVEQHGGRVWLESEENKGTTIYASLPVTNTPPKEHRDANLIIQEMLEKAAAKKAAQAAADRDEDFVPKPKTKAAAKNPAPAAEPGLKDTEFAADDTPDKTKNTKPAKAVKTAKDLKEV